MEKKSVKTIRIETDDIVLWYLDYRICCLEIRSVKSPYLQSPGPRSSKPRPTPDSGTERPSTEERHRSVMTLPFETTEKQKILQGSALEMGVPS